MSAKRDTTRPLVLKVQSPIVIKIVWIVTLALAIVAIAGSAFTLGYGVAWRKIEPVYTDAILLEAKANELEVEISQLRNYAVLIDALALQGKGAYTLQHDVMMIPDTVICTLEVSTPAQVGKE